MNSDKKFGWLLVAIQFMLIGVFFIVIYLETGFRTNASAELKTTGLILCILSLLVIIYSFISFRQPISPNPVPLQDSKLVTSGIYSKIRHPIYLSVIIAFLGISTFFYALNLYIVWIIAVLFLIFKISKEETYLLKKFPEYAEYRQKSWKLMPYLY